MIKRITEIGAVVRDRRSAAIRLGEILGARGGKVLRAPEYKMVAQMFRVGNIDFELMQPLDPDSILSLFLEKRGEGMHHLAFEVDNISETIDELKSRDIGIINDRALLVDGLKAIFIQPRSLGGVLLELIEGTPKWVSDEPLPVALQPSRDEYAIGAEGILEIGIFAENLQAVNDLYSKILPSASSKFIVVDQFSSPGILCHAGNVDLRFIPPPKEDNPLYIPDRQFRSGLSYVTLRVNDLGRSMEYLQNKGVNIQQISAGTLYDSKALLVNPAELIGIPVFLSDELQIGI